MLRELPDQCINLVVTSPPYANQRKRFYPGKDETEYVEWFCTVMDELWRVLRPDGSVLFPIRSHQRNGTISDYVERLIFAVMDRGWIRPEEYVWVKPDGRRLGSTTRPKRKFEPILWFAKSKDLYIDYTFCGNDSDVFVAYRAESSRGINHPARFPPTLAMQLILRHSPRNGVILEPFAGSGTTCLVAQSFGYAFIGIDIMPEFVEMANKRLQTEAKYFRGAGWNELVTWHRRIIRKPFGYTKAGLDAAIQQAKHFREVAHLDEYYRKLKGLPAKRTA